MWTMFSENSIFVEIPNIVLPNIVSALDHRIFIDGDNVLEINTVAMSMYIIESGIVNVCSEDGSIITLTS